MTNILLWFGMMVLNFALIMFAFRKWGKIGLLIWIPISCMIANIQVTKNVILFGFEATLGNIVYSTSFLATDILNEFYSENDAKESVGFGFFALVAMTVLMQMALFFKPSSTDIAQESLQTIFGLMPRIAVGSLIAYLLSNYHDVWAYNFWRRKTSGKHLWLRNNFSTFVSQLIDTVVFTLIAFWGVYDTAVLLQIMASTYLLKWIVALCDTTMIYLARYWVKRGLISDVSGYSPTAN